MSTAELKPEAPERLVTAEELLRKYSGVVCDLIEGSVRTMSPTGWGHGSVERRIATVLGDFVDEHALGDVGTGEVGFLIERDPDTVLAPDVAFVRQERLDAVGLIEGYFPEAPALVVEVTSLHDTAEHVDDKVRRWLAAGCEMVWVVYPRGRSVTVYRSLENVRILTGDAVLDGGGVVPGFSHPISEFFKGIP
ncbi:Uma2 family endonuclease [Botrimarina sp.]|uniref:Uma2 family endonuclease n=1 Tax=Botrimarina sp. TaxID=2795802 RepID=UPI0032EAB5D5